MTDATSPDLVPLDGSTGSLTARPMDGVRHLFSPLTTAPPLFHFVKWQGGDAGAVAVRDPGLLPVLAGVTWVPVSDSATRTVVQNADGSFTEVARVQPVDVIRAARWQAAKAYRAARMARGCKTPLGRVQTDATSRDAITQAANDATNNKLAVPAWSIAWVMEDNTTVTHNAVQMIAMAQAVRVFTAGCQAASQAIRKALDAATTAAAIAAVDITAGYPA